MIAFKVTTFRVALQLKIVDGISCNVICGLHQVGGASGRAQLRQSGEMTAYTQQKERDDKSTENACTEQQEWDRQVTENAYTVQQERDRQVTENAYTEQREWDR